MLPETLTNDAQAAFAIGEWEDAVPGLIAGGQAAREKGNQILVSQSLAYRAIIATGTGDHQAAGGLAAGSLAPSSQRRSRSAAPECGFASNSARSAASIGPPCTSSV